MRSLMLLTPGQLRRALNRLSLYLALFLFLFIVLSPFFWIVKSALSRPDQLFKTSASLHP